MRRFLLLLCVFLIISFPSVAADKRMPAAYLVRHVLPVSELKRMEGNPDLGANYFGALAGIGVAAASGLNPLSQEGMLLAGDVEFGVAIANAALPFHDREHKTVGAMYLPDRLNGVFIRDAKDAIRIMHSVLVESASSYATANGYEIHCFDGCEASAPNLMFSLSKKSEAVLISIRKGDIHPSPRDALRDSSLGFISAWESDPSGWSMSVHDNGKAGDPMKWLATANGMSFLAGLTASRFYTFADTEIEIVAVNGEVWKMAKFPLANRIVIKKLR